MFWSSGDRKCVESDAAAVDPSPQTTCWRTANVAFAIPIAADWAVSRVR